jgi:hypothetical protein
MVETFTALFAAHLIADFVLQWDWMVRNKRKSIVLAGHVAIVGLATALLLGARSGQAALAVLIIVLTHLLIDRWKLRRGDTTATFLADQVAHVVVIAVVALCLPDLARNGAWALLPGDMQASYYGLLVFISGLVMAVPLGGILIKKLIAPIAPSSTTGATVGPRNAGRYIGWLERTLTFGFIIVGKPEGVGFLLAAKSVLRIGDLRDPDDRSQAEYIIIGTFLSFGWALLLGYLTLALARRYAGH